MTDGGDIGRLMERGAREAQRDGSATIEAEHLLLAMAATWEPLSSAGLDHAAIRAALDREFRHSLEVAGVSVQDLPPPRAAARVPSRVGASCCWGSWRPMSGPCRARSPWRAWTGPSWRRVYGGCSEMARSEVVVDVDRLRMRYGTREVLRDVTFKVRRGEVLALLGPNGAGKTSTIEILEGFRTRTSGRVEVFGADPARGDERWRARLGIVLQSWRDHGKWRVRELLAHLGSYYAGRARDVDELIAAAGLADQAGTPVRLLSGGQRRRLDVAIGMVGRPEMLFLDEPTAGFDPRARREFHEIVLGLAAAEATTVLLTTHDLAEAERLADRIMILDGGRIAAEGTAGELARRIAGKDQVCWTLGGRRHSREVDDSTSLVFELFREHGEAVSELEVRRSSLEAAYLALVRRAEEPA